MHKLEQVLRFIILHWRKVTRLQYFPKPKDSCLCQLASSLESQALPGDEPMCHQTFIFFGRGLCRDTRLTSEQEHHIAHVGIFKELWTGLTLLSSFFLSPWFVGGRHCCVCWQRTVQRQPTSGLLKLFVRNTRSNFSRWVWQGCVGWGEGGCSKGRLEVGELGCEYWLRVSVRVWV